MGHERRGQGGQGHALPLDERERRLRAGIRGDHDGPPGHEGAQHTGAGEGEVEPDRQHRQVDGPLVEGADPGTGAGVVGVVVVRPRDELGQAGGAAGQQQQGDVGGVRSAVVGARRGRSARRRRGGRRGTAGHGRRGGPQCVERDEAVLRTRIADHDDRPERAVPPLLRPYLAHQLPVVEPGVPVGHHTGHRTRHAHQMTDLPAPVAGHGVHRDRPEALQSEPGEDELGAVGELDDDAVTPLDAEPPQSVGDAVGLGVQIGIGPPPVPVDQGDTVSMVGARLTQASTEGDPLPVADGPVARRFHLRPAGQLLGHVVLPSLRRSRALVPQPAV